MAMTSSATTPLAPRTLLAVATLGAVAAAIAEPEAPPLRDGAPLDGERHAARVPAPGLWLALPARTSTTASLHTLRADPLPPWPSESDFAEHVVASTLGELNSSDNVDALFLPRAWRFIWSCG